MSLVPCQECKQEMSSIATVCPKCGFTNRKVSFILFIGILLFPIVFAWFTLRKGHSKLAQYISFSWLLICIIFALSKNTNNLKSGTVNDTSTQFNTNPINDLIIKAGENQMDSITAKVATDAVEKYDIANRDGDKIQICVQAMQVSAAFLQAKDEENYKKWKQIEKADCRKAGMPL